jgi:hypothetical protein
MPYTKKDVDPIKQNLIQYLLQLDVPKNKEALRDQLVKQLQRKDYVISDLTKRPGVSLNDVEKEAALYIEKVLKAMFEPEPESRHRFKSK